MRNMLHYFMAIMNIVMQFGIFYGHVAKRWQVGLFPPVLVYCVKKNLATLVRTPQATVDSTRADFRS
jgi:hypothetical protein